MPDVAERAGLVAGDRQSQGLHDHLGELLPGHLTIRSEGPITEPADDASDLEVVDGRRVGMGVGDVREGGSCQGWRSEEQKKDQDWDPEQSCGAEYRATGSHATGGGLYSIHPVGTPYHRSSVLHTVPSCTTRPATRRTNPANGRSQRLAPTVKGVQAKGPGAAAATREWRGVGAGRARRRRARSLTRRLSGSSVRELVAAGAALAAQPGECRPSIGCRPR